MTSTRVGANLMWLVPGVVGGPVVGAAPMAQPMTAAPMANAGYANPNH